MIDSIIKCRDPLRSILAVMHNRIMDAYPDTVVHEPPSMDKEGWFDYAAPDGAGSVKVFAGARFRRDKPSCAIVLAAKPEHDPMGWVHADMGKLKPLGFAFGLPRPFEKDVSEDSMRYVCDLVVQSRAAVLKSS